MYKTWRILGTNQRVLAGQISRRQLHRTSLRHAVSNFTMPAMSPTMTEGGIASWKVKEGDSFAAGDVLLEIETDKATIDVEASDDGVMGKIILQDGAKNVPVGKTIALLAEEGDDISNLEAPKEDDAPPKKEKKSESSKKSASQSKPSPSKPESPQDSKKDTNAPHSLMSPNDIKHEGPMFPSVLRLLLENSIKDTSDIKGTGVRGMITKGDVLAYLGKASSPSGTFKGKEDEVEPTRGSQTKKATKKEEPPKPLSGIETRMSILAAMAGNRLLAPDLNKDKPVKKSKEEIPLPDGIDVRRKIVAAMNAPVVKAAGSKAANDTSKPQEPSAQPPKKGEKPNFEESRKAMLAMLLGSAKPASTVESTLNEYDSDDDIFDFLVSDDIEFKPKPKSAPPAFATSAQASSNAHSVHSPSPRPARKTKEEEEDELFESLVADYLVRRPPPAPLKESKETDALFK